MTVKRPHHARQSHVIDRHQPKRNVRRPVEGEPLAACRERLDRAGVRVAIADVTAPDVAESPFRVARAIGTDMQPIHFGFALRRRRD